MRIHGHNGAVFPFQRFLGRDLQVNIDCEFQLFSGHRVGFTQQAHFASVTVHQLLPRSVLSHQGIVILALHAGYSDHIARVIELELCLVEHVFRHFAHIANQVCHKSLARIQAPIRPDGIQFGQLVAMRFDKGLFVLSDVFFQKDRLILRHGSEMADTRPHFIRIQMQPLRNHLRVSVEVTGGIAQQQSGKRRVVVDDDASFAVQNLATRRENRHIADAVFFRRRRILTALHHLQPPQSVGQHEKDG